MIAISLAPPGFDIPTMEVIIQSDCDALTMPQSLAPGSGQFPPEVGIGTSTNTTIVPGHLSQVSGQRV